MRLEQTLLILTMAGDISARHWLSEGVPVFFCRGFIRDQKFETYDPRDRAKEKQRARDKDEEDLRTGAKTVVQLKQENSFVPFSGKIRSKK